MLNLKPEFAVHCAMSQGLGAVIAGKARSYSHEAARSTLGGRPLFSVGAHLAGDIAMDPIG
jgi:hypothetical protein